MCQLEVEYNNNQNRPSPSFPGAHEAYKLVREQDTNQYRSKRIKVFVRVQCREGTGCWKCLQGYLTSCVVGS